MSSEENRFQPPASDVTEPEPLAITEFELAKRDQRAVGLIIDALFTYPLMLVLKLLPTLFGFNVEFWQLANLPIWLVTLFFYYLLCESIWYKTIGKLITSTRVIETSGKNPSFTQVLSRTFIRFIPLEFITYLEKDKPANGWHDRWSNTHVITQPS